METSSCRRRTPLSLRAQSEMQASALEADGEMPLELTGKSPGADGDHTAAGMGNPCWITAHICIAERQ